MTLTKAGTREPDGTRKPAARIRRSVRREVFIHLDDEPPLRDASTNGEPPPIVVRRNDQAYLDIPALAGLNADEQKLLGRIYRLDYTAHDQLGVRDRRPLESGDTSMTLRRGSVRPTRGYDLIQRVLAQAVRSLYSGSLPTAAELVDWAEATVHRYGDIRSRVRYLQGAAVGLLVTVLVGLVIFRLGKLAPSWMIDNRLGADLVVFAGLGSLVSVLSRLHTLRLGEQLNRTLVWVSGAYRPIAGVVSALVVYLILHTGMIQVTVGHGRSTPNAVYLVARSCPDSRRGSPTTSSPRRGTLWAAAARPLRVRSLRRNRSLVPRHRFTDVSYCCGGAPDRRSLRRRASRRGHGGGARAGRRWTALTAVGAATRRAPPPDRSAHPAPRRAWMNVCPLGVPIPAMLP